MPDKPSKLLKLALHDLKLCEKDSNYNINMEVFHQKILGDKACSVCLAGAIMAKSLKAEKTKFCVPTYFPSWRKLEAVDYFRNGKIRDGLRSMCLPLPETLLIHDFTITPYEENKKLFKKDMKAMIKYLKKQGM